MDANAKIISPKVGYGFLIQFLLSLKGLHLRDGKEVNRNTYMGRTRPLAPKSKVVKPAPPPHELKGKGKDKAKVVEEIESD